MANLTPFVDLTEKVIDNPSAVQVDNSFIVGGVVIVEETDVTEPTLVRSQKELMQHFNGGKNLSESNHVTLKNAYRLVTKCALRLMPCISKPDESGEPNPREAFDKLYKNELLTYSMFSDLGNTEISSYIQTYTKAYRTEDGVLLRTPVFASLSGPNQAELPSSSTKAADGDQWIYHFPWGVDSTTASFKIDICPSVMYIEAVVAARNAGHPYAGIYAHRFGVISNAPDLKVNLGRKDRDKLLGLGYNAIFKDERARYNHTLIVSNRTSTTLNNAMSKESHRRLANKINNDAFIIAEDFIGRAISDLLYEEVTSTFKSYIEGQILVYPESLESYNVICDRTNNDDMDRANNRINIDIQGKFSGEVDYVNILSTYFSVQPTEEP